MPHRPPSAGRRGAFVVLALAVVVVGAGLLVPGGAAAQTPPSAPSPAGASTTSSVVPSLGTAAAVTPAGADATTVETLEPSAVNRPLTTSEQRLEWLDKFAIAGFVVLSIVVVLVRQRRSPLSRGDRYARDNELDGTDAPGEHATGDGTGEGDDDVVLDLRFEDRDPRTDADR